MKTRAIVKAPLLLIRRLTRRLWVRVTLMACLAVFVSVATMMFSSVIPWDLQDRFGPEAVMPVLTILASGMLAVSTFSLNVMVSAHRAAAAQATPRAHRILLQDTTTQTVLATFIGAFVYALSAIILFKSGFFSEKSAVVSMAVTAGVVVGVIIAMLRWIDHLSELGSMDNTLRTIEAEARSSLMQSRHSPNLHANRLKDTTEIPEDAHPIAAPISGYIQLIAVADMDEALPNEEARVWITCAPGKFVLEGQPVGYATGVTEDTLAELQEALAIGDERTFEQDATFGVLVLSEIASRALSPGINDPGTAIDVIGRQEALLWEWARAEAEISDPEYPQIYIKGTGARTLVENAFASIARDGADMIEVVHRLQNALTALQSAGDDRMSQAASALAQRARAYAENALSLSEEKERLH